MKKIISLLFVVLVLISCSDKSENKKNGINISSDGIWMNSDSWNFSLNEKWLDLDMGWKKLKLSADEIDINF